MILVTGMYSVTPAGQDPIVDNMNSIEAGPIWTQQAVESVLPGFGALFVSITIFFFAFTTLMAYYYIAETTLVFLDRKAKVKLGEKGFKNCIFRNGLLRERSISFITMGSR